MHANILKDLGDGLILRRATQADAAALSEFNGRIHTDEGPEHPNEWVATWVHDLASKPHPTFDVGDFTIVEDTASGKVVSSLNLINQTWSYAGIEFGVGRPELVGTDPDYRRRGLVRAQFDAVHQWSAERGHLVQAITGIPNYYRQYGYEMCVALGGGQIGYLPHLPALDKDETEPYTFRPAAEADIPFLMDVTAFSHQRYLLNCQRDQAAWQYELNGRSEKNVHNSMFMIIETPDGEAVGYLRHPITVWQSLINLNLCELKPGVSYLAVAPSVFRYMIGIGKDYAEKRNAELKENQTPIEIQGCNFSLGLEHPLYAAYGEHMPRPYDAYNWYLRVPDLPAFLTLIAPVLEERLAKSYVAGHSGDLKIGFYGPGVKLSFEKGKLKGVEAYTQEHNQDGDAMFTNRTFLRVLFGYNSFAEVHGMFVDVFGNDTGRALLPALFPKQNSAIWPIA